MPRLDAPPAERMDADQRRVHDAIVSGPRGKVEGPLRIWLHSPPLAERAQELGAFCRYHSTLPPRLSELAIITCGAFWRSGFEWAVHAPHAIANGIAPAIVEAIRTGASPAFAASDEAVVHRFVKQLVETRAVDDAAYADAIATLGERAVVDLVGIAGYYTLICMTINVFKVPVPEGVTDPFSDMTTTGD